MNLVHVVESLALGGLERVVVSLVKRQAASGHRVLVVCLFHAGELASQAVAAGAQVAVCDKRPGFDLRALRTMRSCIASFHADVVHTHNAVAHYHAALATISLGVKVLLSTRHGMGSFPFSRRRELLYRLALARTGAAVSVCDAARRRYVAHRIIPEAKAMTVPNGTDTFAFVPRHALARRALLAECGFGGGPVVFGTVGRLSAAKDHANLLAAMRRLVDQGVDAVLVVVGDGELRDTLKAARDSLGLQSRVALLGSRSDIPELLAGFDAFVLSSATEGYSLALVEACAAALPCVATDVGGNAEIVRDGQSGLLVAAGDSGQLAAAMQRLAEDAVRRAAMGRAAREWALRHGTLDAMYERYQAIYERRAVSTSVAPAAPVKASDRA